MKDLDYKKFPLLVVDDEPDNREIFRLNFRREFDIHLAENGAEALRILKERDIAVLITDHRMPNMTGLELLQEVAASYPFTVRIMLTAYTETELLLSAVNEGQIYRYIVKPWDVSEMRVTIKRAIERYHLEGVNRRLLEELRQVNAYLRHEVENDWTQVVGSDAGLRSVMASVERVAPTPTTVLLRGESGTGKELIARAIHLNSPRRDKTMVRVNCAAIPESLLEAELFGVEKGAYTGAAATRKGRFELADGGTIFLDEIGDMSLATQVKLLRVLQEQEFERLGSTRTIKIDTRIIAATNKDLQKAIEAGDFREDLFYRIAVFPIDLPSLRRRPEDIPALANFFLERYAARSNKLLERIAPDAMKRLKEYPWPGNVRELQNVIERATILADGEEMTLNDLRFLDAYAFAVAEDTVTDPDEPPLSGVDLPATIERIERERLVAAMEESAGSKAKAARILGINRSTLYYRLRKHGLGERYGLPEERRGADDEDLES